MTTSPSVRPVTSSVEIRELLKLQLGIAGHDACRCQNCEIDREYVRDELLARCDVRWHRAIEIHRGTPHGDYREPVADPIVDRYVSLPLAELIEIGSLPMNCRGRKNDVDIEFTLKRIEPSKPQLGDAVALYATDIVD